MIRFNIKGFIDRRGPRELEAFRALEQARLDKQLLLDFEDRVRRNEARRYFAAMPERPGLLRHQAD